MIFEWRTYHFPPARATAYLAAFKSEGLPLVTRHLPLLGYWLTESGRLNVLHHLWVYADLDDRASCRAALAADAEWTSGFGPRAFPMIERQETLLLALVEGSTRLSDAVAAARGPHPALAASAPLLGPGWAVLELTEAIAPGTAETIARWQVASGERPGSHVRLSRSDDAAGIAPTVEPALRRELMRPAAFSPLQ
jgi:hypothetical protein